VCAFVGHTVTICCCLQPLQTECDVYLNTSLMESSFVARVDMAPMRDRCILINEGAEKNAMSAQTLAVT